MLKKTKIVLFTEINSKLGSPFLRILSAHPMIELLMVVTSPPNKKCDYFINDKYPVNIEEEAISLGIKIKRPEKVSSLETITSIKEANPDYFIVANFQQLLTRELLDIPNVIPINFHPSPLPRYAGLAPFYWMIKNGETKTSISAIKMDEGIDTGDIIMQRPVHFSEKETCIGLRTAQEEQNILMLLDLIPLMVNKNFSYKPQNTQNRSYFGRPESSDYHLNFQLEAQVLERHIRAAYRYPGAYFLTQKNLKIVVLSANVTNIPSNTENPGNISYFKGKIFVATKDFWLQLLTIDMDGIEVSASLLINEEKTNNHINMIDNVAI
ncbi:formyl transferase [Xenorhabdus sp. M]|uniref:Formyl transferase n=1 Tax=Xenorhabdus szentirmaii TaxID=290112 RepID=A0AAW3YRI5_9GAMM|nr:formyltransferase family protein [Xenorhabdus sp. M]MBD2798898.1 formyl transferase [Xenorhabdus sp. M]